MHIIIEKSYDALSRYVANDIIATLQQYDCPLLCPATGHTTIGLYREMITLHQQQNLDAGNWYYVGLDEWRGLNEEDEGSCKKSLNDQLFNPLAVAEDHICFFDGRASDLIYECTRIEQFIQQHGTIDLSILGLGLNGHVGMNEPGSTRFERSHVAALDMQTQQVSQKYFSDKKLVSQGITLGLGTLLDSKHIFLIVTGKHKAEIIKAVIEGDITEAIPASLLRNHKNFTIYLDADAAALLKL